MNLEKTINKNMFDMPSSIRDKSSLPTADLIKSSEYETSTSTPLSSILSHPKQKLTAQFKRAITMIRQRSEPTHDVISPQLLTSLSLTEKPNISIDSNLLTSLIEEPANHNEHPSQTDISASKSQSFIHIKPPIQRSLSINETDSSATTTGATVINLEQKNLQNQNLSTNSIYTNGQHNNHQTINQQNISPQVFSSSTTTLSPTPSSTATTGEMTILVTNL